MPLVSAIIPCYRCAATLRRAVESVASQTARPFELILVNDGDHGQTALEIARLEKERSGWIRVLTFPENRGVAAARNAGWEIAGGDFIAFLDADDTWMPEKVERQLSFMREHPEFALCGHDALYVSRGRRPFHSHKLHAQYKELTRLYLLIRNPLVTPSLMVRRDLSVRFDPASTHMEDHRFLQEVLFAGFRVVMMRDTLAQVHKAPYGEGGLSGEIWAMAAGDFANHRKLFLSHRIGPLTWLALVLLSAGKLCRRLLLILLFRPGRA